MRAFHATVETTTRVNEFQKSQGRQLSRQGEWAGRNATDEKTSLETSIPIATPIVRESQVGSLLKMFWFALGFMIIAFANPKGRRRGGRESFEQRRAIFGKDPFEYLRLASVRSDGGR